MSFTRKQDYLLTCRDQKCAKTFSNVGNCTHHEKKFGHSPKITTKTERLLYDKTTKLYKFLNKGCSSISFSFCVFQDDGGSHALQSGASCK